MSHRGAESRQGPGPAAWKRNTDEEADLDEPGLPPDRSLTPVGIAGLVILLIVFAAIFGGLGVHFTSHSLISLPRDYDRLSTSGVRVMGTARACHQGRSPRCDLSYSYAGRTWLKVYRQNTGQFAGGEGEAALLIDPADPAVAYTVNDVRIRYVDPLELPLGLGLLFACALLVISPGVGIALRKAFPRSRLPATS